MRRELFALVAGAVGVSMTMIPSLAQAQEPQAEPPATQVTVETPPQQPAVVVTPAPAEEKVVVVPPPSAVASDQVTTTTEVNTGVIVTGALTFGVAYGAAAFAAAQSDRESDERMYVPLLGPWLALADRGDCPVEEQSCDSETTDKVLMAVDGVFQAVGAVTVVYGILSPKTVTHSRTTASKGVRVVPVSMGQGRSAGLGVAGTF